MVKGVIHLFSPPVVKNTSRDSNNDSNFERKLQSCKKEYKSKTWVQN